MKPARMPNNPATATTPSMRVAIYQNSLLPVSQTFIRSQAEALTTWEPILIGRRREKAGLDLSGLHTEIVPETGGLAARALRFWRQRPEPHLFRRLKELDVRLVHAHFGTNATDIWPTVKAAGLPMVVTLHGYDINIHRWWWEAGRGGFKRRWYPRRLLRMAQDPSVHFVAVSKAIKRRAIEFGIPEHKITVSYIGVDTERFRPGGLPIEQRRKRILFVGRMVEKKAPLLMIRAYATTLKKVPNAELVMIGTGPVLEAARRLARSLEAPVQFLGAQSHEEVLAQLHQSRVFCLPSLTVTNGDAEGFGIVILEAQACGIPVATSAAGGAQEGILHGKTGFAFEEGSIDGMVEGMLSLLQNDDLAASVSDTAVRFVRQTFDIRACIRKLETAYDELAVRRDFP